MEMYCFFIVFSIQELIALCSMAGGCAEILPKQMPTD